MNDGVTPSTNGERSRASASMVVDTSRPSPDDILMAGSEAPLGAPTYLVRGRSAVVLVEDAPPPLSNARPTQMMVVPTWLRNVK